MRRSWTSNLTAYAATIADALLVFRLTRYMLYCSCDPEEMSLGSEKRTKKKWASGGENSARYNSFIIMATSWPWLMVSYALDVHFGGHRFGSASLHNVLWKRNENWVPIDNLFCEEYYPTALYTLPTLVSPISYRLGQVWSIDVKIISLKRRPYGQVFLELWASHAAVLSSCHGKGQKGCLKLHINIFCQW